MRWLLGLLVLVAVPAMAEEQQVATLVHPAVPGWTARAHQTIGPIQPDGAILAEDGTTILAEDSTVILSEQGS